MFNKKLSTAIAFTLLSSSLFGCKDPGGHTYTDYVNKANKFEFDFFKEQKKIMMSGDNIDCDILLSKKLNVSFIFANSFDLDVLDFIAYDGFEFNQCTNVKDKIDEHCKSEFAYAAHFYTDDYESNAIENKYHKLCSSMVSNHGDKYSIRKRDIGGYTVSISPTFSGEMKTIKSSDIKELNLKKSRIYSGIHHLDITTDKEEIRLMFGSASLAHAAHQDFIEIM